MNTDSLFIEAPLYEETLPGGGHASFILKRGQVLRITDLEGGANVGMMLLNARQPSERLNLPDTLKGQHTFRLTEGHCLYSDMGRVLAAIVSDSCGWHDSIGGVLDAGEVQAKYGSGRYQELRNGFFRNGHDNLLVEMGKWNLDLEDLLMVVNLFSKVTADEHGILRYVSGNSQAGDHVALYAPMDTLVVLTALQHPMDPNPRYAPRPIRMTWSQARTASIADACRASRPENARLSTIPNASTSEEPRHVIDRQPTHARDRPVSPRHSRRRTLPLRGEGRADPRLLDLEGNQAVDTLFYSAANPRERYDPQRTLRRQDKIYLTTGSVLYSNLGNPLLTIVADTCGRHDTLGGACAQESNTVRYALGKRHMHSCRDNFLRACLHDGRLDKRDIGANINFFMNVPVTPEGGLTFEDGLSGPGKYVELKAAMDVIVLISNCPQLNNPCNGWNPTPAEVLVWD